MCLTLNKPLHLPPRPCGSPFNSHHFALVLLVVFRVGETVEFPEVLFNLDAAARPVVRHSVQHLQVLKLRFLRHYISRVNNMSIHEHW